MTRNDENALVRVWFAWRIDREVRDDLYVEFFDEVVRNDPRFAGAHVFEVLDVLVNAVEPERRASA